MRSCACLRDYENGNSEPPEHEASPVDVFDAHQSHSVADCVEQGGRSSSEDVHPPDGERGRESALERRALR